MNVLASVLKRIMGRITRERVALGNFNVISSTTTGNCMKKILIRTVDTDEVVSVIALLRKSDVFAEKCTKAYYLLSVFL